MIVAIMCAFAYGSEANSNGTTGTILDVIPLSNIFMSILKLILVICITLLYPVINYPYICSVEALFVLSGYEKDNNLYKQVRKIFSIIGLICIVLLDSLVNKVG